MSVRNSEILESMDAASAREVRTGWNHHKSENDEDTHGAHGVPRASRAVSARGLIFSKATPVIAATSGLNGFVFADRGIRCGKAVLRASRAPSSIQRSIFSRFQWMASFTLLRVSEGHHG